MEVPNAAAGIARRGFDEPRPILNDEKTLTQNIQIIKKIQGIFGSFRFECHSIFKYFFITKCVIWCGKHKNDKHFVEKPIIKCLFFYFCFRNCLNMNYNLVMAEHWNINLYNSSLYIFTWWGLRIIFMLHETSIIEAYPTWDKLDNNFYIQKFQFLVYYAATSV